MLKLVCWNPELERERRKLLVSAGFKVDSEPIAPGKLITHIRLTLPEAVVIDLDRLPAHGRTVGVMLRTTESTRAIPLVFLGGAPEKVARVRLDLPDASYGEWKDAASVIRSASVPARAVIPPTHMMEHAGSPLEKKLGLKPGMRLAVIGAPESFVLNADVEIEPRITRNTQLVICFIRSKLELEREMAFLALHPPLWVAFPKQASGLSDFTQHDVRQLAKANDLTDNKVCAIDGTWSAIRFARPLRSRRSWKLSIIPG